MKFSQIFTIPPLVLAVAGAVQAQTGDDAYDTVLEEVVVTGTKIERSLQDTKDSVQVFTAEFIEEQRLWALQDVYLQTANAFELNNGESFGIRGVTQNSQSTGGGTGALGVLYIDGVAFLGFSSRFGPKQLWDVEQVEILRGPQSTNVGRNALIGAVVMTTKQPELDAFEVAGRVEVGNYDTYGLDAMLNAPLGETAALRFVVESRDTDGWLYNQTLDDDEWDARKHRLGRGRFLWEPTDDLSISLMAQYAETERGWDTMRADLLENPEDRVTSDNIEAFETFEGISAALNIDYVFSDVVTLRSITSYLDADYERQNDDDGGPEGGNNFRGRDATDENWAQELRLDFDFGDVGGTAGVFYTDIDLVNNTKGLVSLEPASLGVPEVLLPFYPPLLEIDVNLPFVSNTTNTALFTEWFWDVSDDWRLTAGVRYDDEEQDSQGAGNNSLAPGSELPDPVESGMIADMIQPGLGPIVEAGVAQVNAALEGLLTPFVDPPLNASYDAWLPQFGVTRNLNEDMSIGFLYKRGYRTGGSEINLLGESFDYDPEYLDNYELFWRSVLLDGSMVLNSNIYYGDWSDQQVLQCPMGDLSCTTVNAGESEIYGFEVEVNHAVTDTVRWFTAIGYAHTEFTDFVSDVDGDLSGNRFAFSPEWTASVGGNWQFAERWSVAANVTYQDESFSDVANTTVLDDRTLLNGNIRYETDRFSVVAYGRNLTDEYYITSDFPGVAPDTRLIVAGAPREYGVLFSVFYR